MAEENNELFRKKSVEAIESPEELHNYLKVTSPGVWFFLAAVAVLLVGVIIWGIFGRIETKTKVAVVSENGQCVCVVKYDDLKQVLPIGQVTVDGKDYAFTKNVSEPKTVSDDTDVYLSLAGEFKSGDMICSVEMKDTLKEGVYEAFVVTDSLQPISLLLD